AEGGGIGGEGAAVEALDVFGGALERAGAAIIAEAGPGGEDVALGGAGEDLEGGKFVGEALEVGDDSGDLGLLEHELGDNGAVGAGRLAPGKAAAFVVVPTQKLAAQGVALREIRERRGGRGCA